MDLDRITTRRLCLPADLFFFAKDVGLVVSEDVDRRATGDCEIFEGRGLGRSEFTFCEYDRIVVPPSDEWQGNTTRAEWHQGEGDCQDLDRKLILHAFSLVLNRSSV